jgi:hypothetical protein
VAIAAGGSHSLALTANGSLWGWGYNYYGQLGDGTTTSRATPGPIGSESFSAIAAGDSHSMGLKADGSLHTWGSKTSGLEKGTTSPSLVGTGFLAISAGKSHCLGIRQDGSLWAWGRDEAGQLGDGLDDAQTPRLIPDVAMPFGLAYSANPATYGVGVAVTSNVPTSTGGPIASWAVDPPLPAGLVLDPSTGIVSGTPVAASPMTSHVVTATGPTGTPTTSLLTIKVN